MKTVVPSAASSRIRCADLAGALGVETVGRLVQDEEFAALHQRDRDGQALPHAERVRAELLAGRVREADPFERLTRAGLAGPGSAVRSAASNRSRLACPDQNG